MDDSELVGLTIACRIRLVLVPQRGQVRGEVVAQEAVDVFENARCARQHVPFATAPEDARFVGEDGADGRAEVIAENVGIAVVDQVDERGDRRRVEQIGRRWQILRRPLADVMEAPDDGVDRAIDDGDAAAVRAFDHGDKVLSRRE